MQISDEMVDAFGNAFWSVNAASKIDGQREHIRSSLEAALSTDAEPVGEPLELPYKNWRGEISTRKIRPIRLEFGATEWHPEPQWLLIALDLEKDAERSFALKDFNPAPEPVKTAPAVAVKDDHPLRFEKWWAGRDSKGAKTLDYNERKQLAWDAFYAAALSAQVQDVARCLDCDGYNCDDGCAYPDPAPVAQVLRDRIADKISMTRVEERDLCRTALSAAEQREREARRIALEEAAKLVEQKLGGLMLDSFIFNDVRAKNEEGSTLFLSLERAQKVVEDRASAIRALIPSEPHDAESRETTRRGDPSIFDDAEGRN